MRSDGCNFVESWIADLATTVEYSEEVSVLPLVCLTVSFSIDMMCIKLFYSILLLRPTGMQVSVLKVLHCNVGYACGVGNQ